MSIKVSHSSACLNSYLKFHQRPDFLPIKEASELSTSVTEISEQHCQPTINISLLGKSSVGKTALIVRYLTGKFIGEYESDTDTIYKFDFKLAGSTFPIAIKDYKFGDEITQSKIDDLVSQEDAFVLVYDVCDRRSFDYVRILSYRILSSTQFNNKKRILIVGNKKDLTHMRNVSKKEGELLAKSTQLGIFAETSACEWQGYVPDAFHKLLFVIGSSHLLHSPCETAKPIVEKFGGKKQKRRSQSFKHLSWGSNSTASEANGMFFVQNGTNNNKETICRKPSLQERRKKRTPDLLTVASPDYCSSGASQNTSPSFQWSLKSNNNEGVMDCKRNMVPKFCFSAPYHIEKQSKSMFEFPDVGDKRSLPKTPCCDNTDYSPKGFFNQLKDNFRKKKLGKCSPKQSSTYSSDSNVPKLHRSYSTIISPNDESFYKSNDNIDAVSISSTRSKGSYTNINKKKSPVDKDLFLAMPRFGYKLTKRREKFKSMFPSSIVTS